MERLHGTGMAVATVDDAGERGEVPGLHERIRRFVAGASFEMSANDLAGLEAARPLLAPGTIVAITWLPKETQDSHDARVAAALALRNAGFDPMPHIAARRLRSRDELDRLLGRLANEAGVRRAFLIGGDVKQADGPYASSLDALRSGLFERHGFRGIGIAGYPEAHPSIAPGLLASDTAARIATALEVGLDPTIVTQFCFDAAPILDWTRRLRRTQPGLPVRIGLAAPASVRTLIRFAAICGLGASAKALIGRGASITRLLTEAGPEPVIRDLLAAPIAALGPVALHLFPFGGLQRAARWANAVARGAFTLSNSEVGFRVTREP